ncbi:unnamed protein product [Rotaria sp. Silwood1]|nr:unnamed protein product [Rotaria sp. Silwood1]
MIDDDDDHEYSPIETLIINDCIRLDEINDILSYFPNLHRLSIDYLDVQYLNFNHFEQLIINYFQQVTSLYLSLRHDVDHLNANRWQQLILNYMKNLKIFDLYHIDIKRFDNNNSKTNIS